MIPRVSDALWGIQGQMKFRRVTKDPVDFQMEELTSDATTFFAVMAPIPEQKLLVKPEGQRSWMWWSLWTRTALNVDDIVVDAANVRFRVMSVHQWGAAGFREYQLTESANVIT
jgi:hypothetical protein